MARTNKYTSLNFNDIYDKKTTSTTPRSPSSSLSSVAHPHKSYSLSASSRLTHGGMLVLSRPSSKPQPPPPPQQLPPQQLTPPSYSTLSPPSSKPSDSGSETISLRPQGKTGGSPSFQEREINNKVDGPTPTLTLSPSLSPSPKSNKFVPPHLRPGYVAREAVCVPEFQKPRQGNYRPGSAHGNYHGSPNRYPEDGRPKSGGGFDRRMRAAGAGVGPGGVESDSVVSNRPRSGGSRPSSSG